jgi:hypothetical protein
MLTAKSTLPLFLLLLVLFSACTTRGNRQPVTVPPRAPEPPSAPEAPPLPEGIGLFHDGMPLSPRDLGSLPAGSLVQVTARRDTPHAAVTETLLKLHSMGFLVGIHSAGE